MKRAVIDANNVLHRHYGAMGAERAARHWPRILAALCDAIAGGDRSRVHVAFDGKGGTDWRRELLPEYKRGRKEKRGDLGELLSGAATWATEAGYDVYKVDGAEADDVIAAIVTRHANERACIVSTDSDLHQLLEAGRVNQLIKFQVLERRLAAPIYYTADAFRHEYGIEPRQLPAFKALTGDESDKLVGVIGSGDRALESARAILKRFATLAEATADRWRLPCNEHQRVAIMNAVKSGRLAALENVTTLRRDCLDGVYCEGGQ